MKLQPRNYMNKIEIKAVVCDLDGTLLTSKKKILNETKSVLIELQERGVKLILASSRSLFMLEEIIDALNDHIKSLKKELDEKDEQIKHLHDLLNQSLKNQSQSNFVLAQQNQSLIQEENNYKILPWYRKIFQK